MSEPTASPPVKIPEERVRWGRVVVTGLVCVGLLTGAILIAGALAASRRAAESTDVAVPRTGVVVHEASPRRLEPKFEALGRARPRHQVALSALVGGQVLSVHDALEDGEILAAETTVVRIDPADYEQELARAEAQLAVARAEVKRLKAEESSLDRRFGLAQEQLQLDEEEEERTASMRRQGVGSQREAEVARQAVLRSRDALLALEQTIQVLSPRIEGAEAQVAQAESAVAAAELALARTEIVLPFGGQIARVAVEAYERVMPGQVLFELWDVEHLEIPVALSLAEAKLLVAAGDTTPAATVTVRPLVEGWNEEWPGKLLRLEPVDADNQTVRAIIQVDGASALLPGVFCEVDLAAPAVDVALALPLDALQERDRVHVVREGRLATDSVSVGRRLGTWVEITGGLEPGAQVIVSPLDRAVEGIELEILATDDRSSARAVAGEEAR